MNNFFSIVLLASLGLTWVITKGAILGPVRRWLMARALKSVEGGGSGGPNQWLLDLMGCGQCAGFWSGCLVQGAWSACGHGFVSPWWLAVPTMGFAVSFVAYVVRWITRDE